MPKKVLTLTPNPALDIGGVVDNLRPNEKTYVHDETRDPGGNGINAARILTRLRVPVLATGFLGGATGKELILLLDRERVTNNFVQISGNTRISLTVSNRSDHKQTRLSFPGPEVTGEEIKRLLRFVSAQRHVSLFVVGGSRPKGFEPEDLLRCLTNAKKSGAQCIVDCPGKILREMIPSGPLLIKPNLIEFQELTGTNSKTIAQVYREAKKLIPKVAYVCVSSVEGGALLVTRTHSFFGRIPNVNVKSTVGAGDSMVGAMTAQLFKNNIDGADLLRWGLAAAAATLSTFGTALGDSKTIHQLYKKTKVERIA